MNHLVKKVNNPQKTTENEKPNSLSNINMPFVDPISGKVTTQPKNGAKKISIADEIDKIKQRREERRRKFDDDKKNKLEMINNPDYIPKLDLEYEQLIKNKKAFMEQMPIEPVS